MKKFGFVILAAIAAIATSASALDLQTARAQGMVAEQATGYIVAVASTTEVSQLVEQVNSARKAEYERISKENGQPVDVVAKLAAEQLMKK
jgi:uncharacterized protein YdbL (DUF1318 family)